MTNDKNQNPQSVGSNDEIDILLLVNKLFNLLKRRYLILVLSVIIGACFGWSSYLVQKPLYKSTLIGNSEILRNEYVSLLFKNLNDLLKEGNHEALSNYLKVTNEQAMSIVKIEASPVILKEGNDQSNSDKLVNTFQIDITTLDPSKLDTIQSGIIYYLQNNDFVKKRVVLQKDLYQKLIVKIDIEVSKMDTIRNTMVRMKPTAGGVTYLDPASINNTIVALYERKLILQNALETLNQVLIIQNFIKYDRPVSPILNFYVLGGLSSGLIIGSILILLLEARRKAIQYQIV